VLNFLSIRAHNGLVVLDCVVFVFLASDYCLFAVTLSDLLVDTLLGNLFTYLLALQQVGRWG
jgi:hypothetical protein